MAATFLAYTITCNLNANGWPVIRIGSGYTSSTETWLSPPLGSRLNDSYWFVILNAQNPREKVKEWIVPGNNAVPPAGIETYMDNPAYLFVVATNCLQMVNVPLDALYNFLAKYGAGAELQKLEQAHSVFGYTFFGRVGYILAGTCGPRTPAPPPSYEVSTTFVSTPPQALLMLSLESMPNGGGPYSLSETYTWIPRPPHGQALSSSEEPDFREK